jgi:hypothetical protein
MSIEIGTEDTPEVGNAVHCQHMHPLTATSGSTHDIRRGLRRSTLR